MSASAPKLVLLAGMNCTADLWAEVGFDREDGGAIRPLLDRPSLRAQIDALLEEHSHAWPLDRMPAVDRNLLRIAVFEILHVDSADPSCITPDIAAKVSGIATFNKVPAGLMDALDRLEIFTSLAGPAFYGLPPNAARVTLERMKAPVAVTPRIETGAGGVTVFDPGKPLHWRVRD